MLHVVSYSAFGGAAGSPSLRSSSEGVNSFLNRLNNLARLVSRI